MHATWLQDDVRPENARCRPSDCVLVVLRRTLARERRPYPAIAKHGASNRMMAVPADTETTAIAPRPGVQQADRLYPDKARLFFSAAAGQSSKRYMRRVRWLPWQ